MNLNGIEIERKFLIAAPEKQWLDEQPGSRRVVILQTYLLSPPGETRRIREWSENGKTRYIRTIKRPLTGITREELEDEITEAEYSALLKEKDPQRRQIEKTRWCIPYEGHVLEIDGVQHLGSAEAYRRDRRKDMLLQENGYFVMRFLYNDVLSNLDYVLEAVLWEVRRRQPVL